MPRVIVLDSFPLWRSEHLPVVWALKIPGMVSCGQASIRTRCSLVGIASEGRLAERHTDGGFQPSAEEKEQAAQ